MSEGFEMCYKPDWPQARARWETIWQGKGDELDRPIMLVTAPNGREVIYPNPSDSYEDHWLDPGYALAAAEARMAGTYYAGEAFPSFIPSTGTCLIASVMGSKLEYKTVDEVWARPRIKRSVELFDLEFRSERNYWERVQDLTYKATEVGAGKFMVGITHMCSPSDDLSLIMTNSNLCMEMLDYPEEVKAALGRLQRLWFKCYQTLYDIIQQKMEGSTAWNPFWYPGKGWQVQNDFSAMISPALFNQFIAPQVDALCEWLDYSVYHLDGPGAIPHLDRLLTIPRLNGVQWVPGDGQPPQLAWPDVLHRIQAAGKILDLYLSPDEVPHAIMEYDPSQMIMQVSCDSPEQADLLLNEAVALTAKSRALRKWER